MKNDSVLTILASLSGVVAGRSEPARVIGMLGRIRRSPRSLKDRRVPLEDPPLSCQIRLQRLHAALLRSAEQDAVPARKHVQVVVGGYGVVHFRLGEQDSELSFDPYQIAIAEEFSSTEAGTVRPLLPTFSSANCAFPQDRVKPAPP